MNLAKPLECGSEQRTAAFPPSSFGAAIMKQALWMLVMTVAIFGCGARKHPSEVVAEELQRSFLKTNASMTNEIVEASDALRASNYVAAILVMDRVVQAQVIDDAQKKAVDTLIVQTRKAVEQNPKLNSPQLYQALSDLQLRVHGEN